MRRAAVSIPSNIAEGHARRSDGVYLNHLRIALGSQAELLTRSKLQRGSAISSPETTAALVAQVDQLRQVLHGLRRSLNVVNSSVVSLGLILAA